ncbi:MAG: SulP family inorganic anion transporter [Myxococcota bacterium]
MQIPKSLFKEDLLASVVVFLVALPLCMGIAIASGAPPALGLITGMVGGLLVGFLAGSPLQVSGPAAGLAVLVYEIVQAHGVAGLGVVVLLGGAIQLGAGLLRAGQWFRAVSPAVIQGMLAGIGVLIFASQFHVMVDAEPRGSGLENLYTIPQAIYKGVTPTDGDVHHLAAAIGLTTIAVIVLWSFFGYKKLPAPLIAVVIATAVAVGFEMPIRQVEVPGNLWDDVTLPSLATMADMGVRTLLVEAIAIAFIASAETLLCATAVDQMHPGPRTNYNRELAAQGVGNMVCGALGALPMTGVIVRSSANVQAGAKTRASAIMHGAWLFILVVMAPFVLELIPTASLAAVLVYTGYKLVNPTAIRRLYNRGKGELGIYLATVVGIVALDLLSGVLIGLGLAAGRLLLHLSQLEIDQRYVGGRHDVTLRGAATFIGLPKLARALETLPEGQQVHLHVRDLSHVDLACLELLTNFRKRYEDKGGEVVVEWDELHQRFSGPPPQ